MDMICRRLIGVHCVLTCIRLLLLLLLLELSVEWHNGTGVHASLSRTSRVAN